MKRRKTEWVPFATRVEDPKLAYLEHLLTAAGISHRRHGHSAFAPIVLVPSEQVTPAWGLLDKRAKRDLRLPAPQGLTLDELVDDHPLFYRDGFDPSQVVDGPEWWIYQPSDWIRPCHRGFQAAS